MLRVLFAAWCLGWFPLLVVAFGEQFGPVSSLRRIAQAAALLGVLATWGGGLVWASRRMERGRGRASFGNATIAFLSMIFLLPAFGPLALWLVSRSYKTEEAK